MICQSNFPRRVAQTKHSFTEGALILWVSLSSTQSFRRVCVWSQSPNWYCCERYGGGYELEREYNILSPVCVFVRCAREYIIIKIMRAAAAAAHCKHVITACLRAARRGEWWNRISCSKAADAYDCELFNAGALSECSTHNLMRWTLLTDRARVLCVTIMMDDGVKSGQMMCFKLVITI